MFLLIYLRYIRNATPLLKFSENVLHQLVILPVETTWHPRSLESSAGLSVKTMKILIIYSRFFNEAF